MTSTTLTGVRSWQRLAITNTFTKAVADRMLLTVIAGAAMGAMSFAMGPMWLALEDVLLEMLEMMPEELFAIAGGVDMGTPSGWYTGEMYSILVPFALMFVAVSSAARAFGGQQEEADILDEESSDPEIQLDLARAYISMGDKEAARVILEEVASNGSEDQQAEARKMLDLM